MLFYGTICHIAVDQLRLKITCRFTAALLSFPGAWDPQLAAQLLQEIHNYRAQLFAESTKTTYKTHCDTYLCFCMYMGYCPVPVQPGHLLQYAAFLAHMLKASSVCSYLNIIGILHKEFALLNNYNWPLKSLLTGINRSKGLTPNQKQPITTATFHTRSYHQPRCFTLSDMSGRLLRHVP